MVEMADHRQVILQGQLAQRMHFRFEQPFFPVVAGPATLLGWDAVVGQLMGVDAGQQLGATPDIEDALAQQRAQGPLLSRVHVGGGNEIGAQ